jgi:peptidylprolyl isomerase domain and WD repeat-containing protein 1
LLGLFLTFLFSADQDSKNIYIFDSRGDGEPIAVLDKIHSHPVNCMVYNHIYKCVISSDKSGMIEYWDPNEPHDLPPSVEFERKFQTDLYEFKKVNILKLFFETNANILN